MHYKIKAQNITEEQLDKALQLVKNCTIVQSVKDSIKVTETIELIVKQKNVRIRLSRFSVLERGSMMECLGCKLANEEEKIYRVYEDEYVTCF